MHIDNIMKNVVALPVAMLETTILYLSITSGPKIAEKNNGVTFTNIKQSLQLLMHNLHINTSCCAWLRRHDKTHLLSARDRGASWRHARML